MLSGEIDITIPNRYTPWELVPLSDWHLGNRACYLRGVKETVAYVRDTPNVYAFLGGDICEAIWIDDAKRFDPSVHLAEDDEDGESLKVSKDILKNFAKASSRRAADILFPIKDKLLFSLQGNHEYEFAKRHSFDMTEDISERLGIQYCGDCAAVRIRVLTEENGKSSSAYSFSIYAHHGVGSAQTEGAIANKAVSKIGDWEADAIWMGHYHKMRSYPKARLSIPRSVSHRTAKESDKPFRVIPVVERTVMCKVNGGFLRGYVCGIDTYISSKNLSPASLGVNSFKIHQRKLTENLMEMVIE
jgi:hypothetical protein